MRSHSLSSSLSIVLALLLLHVYAASPGSGTPEDAEAAGDLALAGYLYELEGNDAGVCRVRCRLLEEALYAGHVNRAQILLSDLSTMGMQDGYLRFWWGRLAWGCGLPDLAIDLLAVVDTGAAGGDDWLRLRSIGLAQLYSGEPDSAAATLALSLEAGRTARRKLYSAVDLCMALVQSGRAMEASLLSARLVELFPRDGLALVTRGIVLVSAASTSGAFSCWAEVSSKPGVYGIGPASMAQRLIAELE